MKEVFDKLINSLVKISFIRGDSIIGILSFFSKDLLILINPVDQASILILNPWDHILFIHPNQILNQPKAIQNQRPQMTMSHLSANLQNHLEDKISQKQKELKQTSQLLKTNLNEQPIFDPSSNQTSGNNKANIAKLQSVWFKGRNKR